MDPIVTGQILNAARLIHERMDGLANRLDAITSKLDQLVYREMKSAYDALQAALLTTNASTREQRLAYAENALLLNTGLKENLITDNEHNSVVLACAHFGLSYIAFLRCDEPIAARHLLQSFEISPRLSREVLAPQLYEKLILPGCRQIIRDFEDELEEVAGVGTEREAPETLADRARDWWITLAGDDPTIVTQVDYDAEVARIEEEREVAIDERCSEVARELLQR